MAWIQSAKTATTLRYTNTLTNEQFGATLIYNHPEWGAFYAFDSLLEMPIARKHLFELANQMERVGIEKKELSEKMQTIMNLCKDRQHGFELEVYNIAKTIDAFIKDSWDYYKTSLYMCAMLIFQEGDNVATLDQAEAQRKINLWSTDKNMIAFFLSILAARSKKVSESSSSFTQLFSE